MEKSFDTLTPREIVAELDRFIIGQDDAKRAVAVALRNRFRRQQLPRRERDEIHPKNILMIGPTGVGKTEIARRLAQLAKAPMIKVEATKFTEVGYVGRDVESMIRDLAAASVRLVEKEKVEALRPEAFERAIDRIADLIQREERDWDGGESSLSTEGNPLLQQAMRVFGYSAGDTPDGTEPEEAPESPSEPAAEPQPSRQDRQRSREELLKQLRTSALDENTVEIEMESQSNPFVQVFSQSGMEEMGMDLPNLFKGRSKRVKSRMTVGEAKEVLTEQEARGRLDEASVHREAIERAEQSGIIFLDEIDKIAMGRGRGSGPDVSREGVQRDLLPIIEGSTVSTKFGQVHTDNILFIAAGAFHESKPSDLIPELQGRLPIRVELQNLAESDFRRILKEPENALTKQYQLLLKVEGVELQFTEDGLDRIAELAVAVNESTENIGARRLHTLLEKLLEPEMFAAPDDCASQVVMDAARVDERLKNLSEDQDLSRFIL